MTQAGKPVYPYNDPHPGQLHQGTSTQKLEALVKRAIEKGWSPSMDASRPWTVEDVLGWYNMLTISRAWDEDNWKKFIFSHDFARALFGEEMVAKKYPMCEHSKPAYQYNLQQAVISDDPIDYMYKAVFGMTDEDMESVIPDTL